MSEGSTTVVHNEASEARDSFHDAFDRFAEADQWMGAVWMVDNEGILHVFRTTWHFPRRRFDDAMAELKRSLQAETQPPVPAPLPRANIFPFPGIAGKLRLKRVEGDVRETPAGACDEPVLPEVVPAEASVDVEPPAKLIDEQQPAPTEPIDPIEPDSETAEGCA